MASDGGRSGVRQRTKQSSSLPFHSESHIPDHHEEIKKFPEDVYEERHLYHFILLTVSVTCFVVYCDSLLPTPKPVKEVLDVGDGKLYFSEERARSYINDISSFGPRPTGSYENEILAVDYLVRQLKRIQNASNNSVNKVEIDIQKVTGSFYVEFEEGLTTYYKNVKNLVAKVGPSPSTRSLLVNCHFDSVPTSPGASDDVISCAVMLEILEVLSKTRVPLKHSVIFLFNGAEENFLQASHGFITQHPWAKNVAAFINLEACGAGGREVLFQAGPGHPWLVEAYAKGAKHPFGSIVAQEIFQGGLIPSDTDFRIFREFGNIPGLDFAFAMNGYVYHTRFDSREYVTKGSVQHEGDNVLGTIMEILKNPNFQHPVKEDNSKLVYFDVIGLFMISYTGQTGLIIHGGSVIVTLLLVAFKNKGRHFHKSIVRILKAVAIIFASFLVSVVCTMMIAVFLDFMDNTLSYFHRPYFIVGLYICPAFLTFLFIHSLVSMIHEKDVNWNVEETYLDAVQIFWCALVCLMLWRNIFSAFLPAAWLIFPTLTRILTHALCGRSKKDDLVKHVLPYLGMQIIPMMLTIYCWWQLYVVFVPIMGRVGAQTNPDLLIGIISTIVVFSTCSYVFPLVQTIRSIQKTFLVLLGFFVLTLLVVCITPYGFPYSDDPEHPTPQRFWIKHVHRTFHTHSGLVEKEDSGLWIIPLDHNGPHSVFPDMPDLKRNAKLLDCTEKFYCGMPYYFPIYKKLSKSYYMPGPKPIIHMPKKFELVSQKIINSKVRRLSFSAKGPDHMNVLICPHQNITLSKWSLSNGTARTEFMWNSRPVYFVYYSHGETTEAFDFWIELEVPLNHHKRNPLVDVSFITHNIHGNAALTPYFQSFLVRMPTWTHTIGFTSTYDGYTF